MPRPALLRPVDVALADLGLVNAGDRKTFALTSFYASGVRSRRPVRKLPRARPVLAVRTGKKKKRKEKRSIPGKENLAEGKVQGLARHFRY